VKVNKTTSDEAQLTLLPLQHYVQELRIKTRNTCNVYDRSSCTYIKRVESIRNTLVYIILPKISQNFKWYLAYIQKALASMKLVQFWTSHRPGMQSHDVQVLHNFIRIRHVFAICSFLRLYSPSKQILLLWKQNWICPFYLKLQRHDRHDCELLNSQIPGLPVEFRFFFIDTFVSLAVPTLQLRLTTNLFSNLDSKLKTNSQNLSIDQCRVLVLICSHILLRSCLAQIPIALCSAFGSDHYAH
jgi:hypothetical protein